MKSFNWNKTHTVLSCILLLITIIGAVLEMTGRINLFKSSASNKVKIKGYIYKGDQKEPCKECTVIIKDIQKEKTLDGNGFYLSDPLRKEELPLFENVLDCKIQIKINGATIEERIERITLFANETEFSFGEIVLKKFSNPDQAQQGKSKYNIDIDENKGNVFQGDQINLVTDPKKN